MFPFLLPSFLPSFLLVILMIRGEFMCSALILYMVHYFPNNAFSGVCVCLCVQHRHTHISCLAIKPWKGLCLIYYSPPKVYRNVFTILKKKNELFVISAEEFD